MTPAELEAEPMLQWFAYEHLPQGPLRATSAHFAALAHILTDTLPRTAERSVALRKLLESKDAAVRCAVAVARAQNDPVVGHERAAVGSPALRYEDPGRAPGASA